MKLQTNKEKIFFKKTKGRKIYEKKKEMNEDRKNKRNTKQIKERKKFRSII